MCEKKFVRERERERQNALETECVRYRICVRDRVFERESEKRREKAI